MKSFTDWNFLCSYDAFIGLGCLKVVVDYAGVLNLSHSDEFTVKKFMVDF
jgi:hypothetical protein